MAYQNNIGECHAPSPFEKIIYICLSQLLSLATRNTIGKPLTRTRSQNCNLLELKPDFYEYFSERSGNGDDFAVSKEYLALYAIVRGKDKTYPQIRDQAGPVTSPT